MSRLLSFEDLKEQVVQHYVRAGRWQQEDYSGVVTNYEIERGFERV